MAQLTLEQIDSIDALRRMAPAWDRLWETSEVSLPTVRAELVAQWVECFAPRSGLRVFAVRQSDRLVAALPLVRRRVKGLLPVGDLTSNPWSPNGELLLDPAADPDAVLDCLASALQQFPWPLVWLDYVPAEAPRWQALCRALARCRLPFDLHPRYRIGQVELEGDFEHYFAQRSKNLRRSIQKDLRRLQGAGDVGFRWLSHFAPDEVDAALHAAFELEQRSWKQGQGQTVLGTPGMFEFYCRQARPLAEWGYLRVGFLDHAGKPIACEVGWTAKGVYHSFKVAYDASYGSFGPGHLLRMHAIRDLFGDPAVRLVDFQGETTEALAAWATRSYTIARLVVAPRRPASRFWFAAYRALAPWTRRWRRALARPPHA